MATNAETHVVSIGESVEQMCKLQDQSYSGNFVDDDTGEIGKWAMITDGHGTNTCIRFLREIPNDIMSRFIGTNNPVITLSKYVNNRAGIRIYECSGATMCLLKVYSDRVVCFNCGDSQAAIYKNGKLEFLSVEHNWFNPREKQRLYMMYQNIRFIQGNNIEVASENKLISAYSEYACFPYSNIRLALTQAIGHCGRTGYAPDITTIHFEPNDTVNVVIGSDGFWDMLMK